MTIEEEIANLQTVKEAAEFLSNYQKKVQVKQSRYKQIQEEIERLETERREMEKSNNDIVFGYSGDYTKDILARIGELAVQEKRTHAP